MSHAAIRHNQSFSTWLVVFGFAIQHSPVVDTRHTAGFVRQEGLDHAPLVVGQIVSALEDAEPPLPCLKSSGLQLGSSSTCA
jgi:hypothetical protein